MRIGLIADTHGYLGDDVLRALDGCDLILHAGDIGPGVLPALATVAPVTAVRGNNDVAGPEALLPELVEIHEAPHDIALVHRYVDAPPPNDDILVFGHCHRRHDERSRGRWLLNPGAAGKRGFHTRRSVAVLRLESGHGECQFIDLGPRKAAP